MQKNKFLLSIIIALAGRCLASDEKNDNDVVENNEKIDTDKNEEPEEQREFETIGMFLYSFYLEMNCCYDWFELEMAVGAV